MTVILKEDKGAYYLVDVDNIETYFSRYQEGVNFYGKILYKMW